MTGVDRAMRFTDALKPTSFPAYLLWRANKRRSRAVLAMRGGPRLEFRPRTPTANDYGLAYEVFVHRFYDSRRPLDPASVRRIVDLGGNVGFTPLYWTETYPHARVVTYEPHPAHIAQLRRNLDLNRSGQRVELRAAAAGTQDGHLRLSDEGTSSSTVATNGHAAPGFDVPGFDVPVEDCLAPLAGQRVDILKIDIEGAEYAIMRDARFAALDVARVVMEWHNLGDGQDGAWCVRRLGELGYEVEPIFDEGSHGMLWAYRA